MQTINVTDVIRKNSTFISMINRDSGQDVKKCYQCGKCSAGCPLAPFMDVLPNQVIRKVQLGMRNEVLNCESIWLCAYCSTCSVRCPRNIELAEVMDSLRILAQRENIRPKGRAKKVSIFNKGFLRSLKKYGRLHEFTTMLGFNIKSGKPFNNAETGLFMLTNGKLKLSVSSPQGMDEINRIFEKTEELEEKRP